MGVDSVEVFCLGLRLSDLESYAPGGLLIRAADFLDLESHMPILGIYCLGLRISDIESHTPNPVVYILAVHCLGQLILDMNTHMHTLGVYCFGPWILHMPILGIYPLGVHCLGLRVFDLESYMLIPGVYTLGVGTKHAYSGCLFLGLRILDLVCTCQVWASIVSGYEF